MEFGQDWDTILKFDGVVRERVEGPQVRRVFGLEEFFFVGKELEVLLAPTALPPHFLAVGDALGYMPHISHQHWPTRFVGQYTCNCVMRENRRS